MYTFRNHTGIEKANSSNAKRPHDETDLELNQKPTKLSKSESGTDAKFDEQDFYDKYDDKLTLNFNLKKLPLKKREQMYNILIEQLSDSPFKNTNLTEIKGYSYMPRKDNNNNKIISKL